MYDYLQTYTLTDGELNLLIKDVNLCSNVLVLKTLMQNDDNTIHRIEQCGKMLYGNSFRLYASPATDERVVITNTVIETFGEMLQFIQDDVKTVLNHTEHLKNALSDEEQSSLISDRTVGIMMQVVQDADFIYHITKLNREHNDTNGERLFALFDADAKYYKEYFAINVKELVWLMFNSGFWTTKKKCDEETAEILGNVLTRILNHWNQTINENLRLDRSFPNGRLSGPVHSMNVIDNNFASSITHVMGMFSDSNLLEFCMYNTRKYDGGKNSISEKYTKSLLDEYEQLLNNRNKAIIDNKVNCCPQVATSKFISHHVAHRRSNHFRGYHNDFDLWIDQIIDTIEPIIRRLYAEIIIEYDLRQKYSQTIHEVLAPSLSNILESATKNVAVICGALKGFAYFGNRKLSIEDRYRTMIEFVTVQSIRVGISNLQTTDSTEQKLDSKMCSVITNVIEREFTRTLNTNTEDLED